MKKKRNMSKRKRISSLLLLYLGQKDGLTPGSKGLRGGDPIIKRVDLFQCVLKINRPIIVQVFVRCSIAILGSDILLKQ